MSQEKRMDNFIETYHYVDSISNRIVNFNENALFYCFNHYDDIPFLVRIIDVRPFSLDFF